MLATEGQVLLRSGDAPGAEKLLHEAIALADGLHQTVPLEKLNAQLLLSAAWQQQGRLPEATATARTVVDRVKRLEEREFFKDLEARAQVRLAESLLRAGDPRAALDPLRRAVALRQEIDCDYSPYLAQSRATLAACLTDPGR